MSKKDVLTIITMVVIVFVIVATLYHLECMSEYNMYFKGSCGFGLLELELDINAKK